MVSILSRPEGQELLGPSWRRRSGSRVSILSRPEGQELPSNCSAAAFFGKFQSSPDPKVRSYKDRIKISRICSWVSILSRPEGQELPGVNSGS